MHEQTRQELVKNAIGLCRELGRDLASYVATTRRLEKEHELDRKVLEARERAGENGDTPASTSAPPEPREPAGAPTPSAAEIETEIDELIAEETCGTCRSILQTLKERPPREQVRGLKEYGQWMGQINDNADGEELRETLRETVVLHSIIEQSLAN